VRITLVRKLAQIVLWVACSSITLQAAKHPVPLEENADGAKCLECHEAKAKGESVHTAVGIGCLACHEVRVAGDVTRVKLKTATAISLCLQCHENRKAVIGKSPLHPPAEHDCTTCHDPHESPNQNHMVKPLSGNKADNLCLKCHSTGLNVPEKGSRHAALDKGCNSCHVTHKTGTPGKLEFEYHQKKDPREECVECHDLKTEAIASAHQGQPVIGSNCLNCHDIHQSDGPKLIQKFVHAPYAKKSCDICHQAPKDGKVVLTKASSKELCLSCHEETAKKIQSAKVQHAGAKGNCLVCHNPHAGPRPGLVRPDLISTCTRCHRAQAEFMKTKKVLHQAAYRDGCGTCHESHGSENSHLLRTKTINSLCLECHGPDANPAPGKDAHTVTIFNGRVRLPGNYFKTVPTLPIRYSLGHPIARHPVSDQMDPADVTKVRAAINCCSCHQPHASAERNLLVKDQANNLMFCAGCHKDMGK
jgi:predicted CXXCH cytochrome family protein